MAVVELIGVTKRWGDVAAVEPTNLRINDGEFVAILGPSGCGKSTTLFMLAGIYAPSEGDIRFDGALVQVQDLLARKPSEMSGGQQQRIALARALVKEPQLLLLDEPLSNLDASLRLTMRGEIRRLQRSLGVTTILVTHDQTEATTMADRIICMSKGRIEQIGTADQLYHRRCRSARSAPCSC